jgi:hypothetical protein
MSASDLTAASHRFTTWASANNQKRHDRNQAVSYRKKTF